MQKSGQIGSLGEGQVDLDKIKSFLGKVPSVSPSAAEDRCMTTQIDDDMQRVVTNFVNKPRSKSQAKSRQLGLPINSNQ